jgi:hypothetical protein
MSLPNSLFTAGEQGGGRQPFQAGSETLSRNPLAKLLISLKVVVCAVVYQVG